jgi:antitoxin component YwqK of YwqJK toxin-antitoxin module
MHRLLILSISLFLLAACNKTTVKKELFENGSVKSEKTFEKIGGEEKLIQEVVYHPNGQKYMEGAYKDNLREGKWTSWYEDGTLWSEGEFVAGENQGKTSVFHPSGQLHYEGSFNNGERIGIWTFFDENGIKIKEIDYDTTP